jgi:hypothetical protein
MAHNIFGFKFGIKTSQKQVTTKVRPRESKLMNIPPADDILDFSYPPESQFYSETNDKSYR